MRGLHRRRLAGARELCEPDPHRGRRHPRVGPQGRAVRRGEGLHRAAQPDAQGREADARGRVFARQLRAQRQGARPAVPGPDQGAPELARCAAPGVDLRETGDGAVAEPACGGGQEARRAGDQAGPDPPARQPEGGKAQGLGRGRAAGQADRLREPRPEPQRALSGGGRLRRWQRQDGPRQGDPGDPAAARQGAQCLGGRARPPVCQQRDPRHRGGHRRGPARPQRQPRHERPALRQGLHPERRRCGRLAHPGAAADPVLPPLSPPDRHRPPLHRQAAAVPRGCAGAWQEARRQDVCPGRRRAHRHPRQAPQGGRP